MAQNDTNLSESFEDYITRVYNKLNKQHFGPEDSAIASYIMHPIEGATRLGNEFTKNVNAAMGVSDLYDNPTPFSITPAEQVRGALNVATMAGTGAMPFNQSGPATLGTFAGLGSKTANRLNAGLARDMEAAGKSPEEILNATGWFRGAEGRQRYEINDAAARMKLPMDDILESPLFGKAKGNYVLQDVLDHPELYKAYPELASVPFVKRPGFLDFGGLQGWRGENQIGLTPYTKDPLGTLLHEAQHYIQEKEGFGLGGNAESVLNVVPESTKLQAAKEAIDKLSSKISRTGEVIKGTEKYANDPSIAEIQNINALKNEQWRNFYKTGDKESLKANNDLIKVLGETRNNLAKKLFGKENIYKLSPIERDILEALESPDIHNKNIKSFTDLQQDLTGIQSGDLKILGKHTDTHELYKRLAGETEARNVPDRRRMTNEERRAKPAWETQEYPFNEQFINIGK